MRRVIAAFLLACLGIMLPLAATSARVCVVDHRLLVPGISECGAEKAPACPDCGEPHEDPCCVELDELPEAPPLAVPVGLPAIAASDLPWPDFIVPPAVLVAGATLETASPARAPDDPAARRAQLEIWRL